MNFDASFRAKNWTELSLDENVGTVLKLFILFLIRPSCVEQKVSKQLSSERS